MQILPGAEAAPGSGDHDAAQSGIGGLFQGGLERPVERAVERVEDVRPVEGDRQDGSLAAGQHLAHGPSLHRGAVARGEGAPLPFNASAASHNVRPVTGRAKRGPSGSRGSEGAARSSIECGVSKRTVTGTTFRDAALEPDDLVGPHGHAVQRLARRGAHRRHDRRGRDDGRRLADALDAVRGVRLRDPRSAPTRPAACRARSGSR